jgi:hypothetical protein
MRLTKVCEDLLPIIVQAEGFYPLAMLLSLNTFMFIESGKTSFVMLINLLVLQVPLLTVSTEAQITPSPSNPGLLQFTFRKQ